MKAWEALKALQEGKKVRCCAWNPCEYRFDSLGSVRNHKGDTCAFALINLEVEWEIYEEPGHDFSWAIEQLKAGKSVRRKDWIRYESTETTYFLRQVDGQICDNLDEDDAIIDVNDCTATDWILA